MTENHSRMARRKQQKKKPKKSLWKTISKVILLTILAIGLGISAIFAYFILTAPKLDFDKLDVPYASQFYDKDGELFADIGEEKRIKIQYEDLPDVLIDAVIATEDARFFKHAGIDLRRIGGEIGRASCRERV